MMFAEELNYHERVMLNIWNCYQEDLEESLLLEDEWPFVEWAMCESRKLDRHGFPKMAEMYRQAVAEWQA